MLKLKSKPAEIAKRLGVHRSTIYRELNKGTYYHVDYMFRESKAYSSDIAHEKYRSILKAKGQQIKLGNDYEFAEYIESKIVDDKYSPDAVLGEIREKGIKFKTTICTSTLYSYIEKGVFINLTNEALMYRGKRKRKYRKIRPKRAPRGQSIEKRSDEINDRKEIGHWEMDLLVGRKNTLASVLVLTERKTRTEIMMKLKDKTTKSVIEKINQLEENYGKSFPDIFKSITVDNGSEFSNCEEMETSKNGKRTTIYYCHPFSSWERGSNENQNKMIRRHFPKGTDFTKVTEEQLHKVEVWINNYPRKIFGYKSSYDELSEQLKILFK